MEIITTKKCMQQRAKELRMAGNKIGFVPTMGYLHEGHLKLVDESVSQNDITVMSIFVNPLQFGPGEDFEAYPRDYERDKALAEKAGVNILFLPDRNDIYSTELSITLNVQKRTDVLCGKSRPGHFNGVVTILTKLFNIVMPDHAYFGLKDAQQVAVVDSLISDFDFPIKLQPVETVRETDGLAKSSRNVYLSSEEREQAPHLFKALEIAKSAILHGEKDPQVIINQIREHLETHTNGTIDYAEILQFPNLRAMTELQGKIIIAIAVKFSRARLIDNMLIEM